MRRIRRIPCEDPLQKMWDHFIYFENEPVSKNFLQERYDSLGYAENAHRLAFQNTEKLIYYIKQAREYYHTARNSHILVQPLLYYYGMVSLIKALFISYDPFYPRNTKMLSHGITTRKIKSKNYVFHDDEMKVQKEGMLPFLFDILLHYPNPTPDMEITYEKYRVKHLLSLLPELSDAYLRLFGEETQIPIIVSEKINFTSPATTLYLPEVVLDRYHLTYPSFVSYLNQLQTGTSYFMENNTPLTTGNIIRIDWVHEKYVHVDDSPNGFENPLFKQDYKGHFYLSFLREKRLMLPEEVVHFMLMYSLGMLCRYETDLWGDMHFSFSSEDTYIINEFLHASARKFPNCILNLLMNERYIFVAS